MMIRIIESSADKLKIKQYPANQWLAFIFLALLSTLLAYHNFFQSPTNSSLVCSKDFLNRTNCQLIESALLNRNLTDRQIKNIKEPRIKFGSRSRVIWLRTDIKIWHGKIKNVYYPSSLFLDPFLYRTNKQVSAEIEKLNRFINSQSNSKTLTIERKAPRLFYIIIWIIEIPLFLPIIFIFIFPITTYYFDLTTKSFTVAETTMLSTEEKEYLLEHLKVVSKIEKKESSIVLTLDNKQEYILKDIAGEKELPKILELIKPFTNMSAKDS